MQLCLITLLLAVIFCTSNYDRSVDAFVLSQQHHRNRTNTYPLQQDQSTINGMRPNGQLSMQQQSGSNLGNFGYNNGQQQQQSTDYGYSNNQNPYQSQYGNRTTSTNGQQQSSNNINGHHRHRSHNGTSSNGQQQQQLNPFASSAGDNNNPYYQSQSSATNGNRIGYNSPLSNQQYPIGNGVIASSKK